MKINFIKAWDKELNKIRKLFEESTVEQFVKSDIANRVKARFFKKLKSKFKSFISDESQLDWIMNVSNTSDARSPSLYHFQTWRPQDKPGEGYWYENQISNNDIEEKIEIIKKRQLLLHIKKYAKNKIKN